MNDRQNENASRIAAYLGNRLSPEEREAFKRLLSEDDELRVQYVNALMNRAGTEPVAHVTEPVAVESVPEPEVVESVPESEVVESVPEPEVSEAMAQPAAVEVVPEPEVREGTWDTPGEQRARVGFLGSGWIVGITVLLLIVAGVVIFTMNRHQQYWDKTVAAMTSNSGDVDKVVPFDSATAATADRKAATPVSKVESATKGTGSKGGLMDSLYMELYKPYMRGDDPVEVREYYRDYKAGNYAAVLSASDSVATAVEKRKLQIKNYIRLYKGLAYLATGNAPEAVEKLDAVVLRTNPGDELYEVARWYLALAWLKRSDVDPAEAQGKALGLAKDISRGYSRYRDSARELVRALGS
jgi:hypothetical protein